MMVRLAVQTLGPCLPLGPLAGCPCGEEEIAPALGRGYIHGLDHGRTLARGREIEAQRRDLGHAWVCPLGPGRLGWGEPEVTNDVRLLPIPCQRHHLKRMPFSPAKVSPAAKYLLCMDLHVHALGRGCGGDSPESLGQASSVYTG